MKFLGLLSIFLGFAALSTLTLGCGERGFAPAPISHNASSRPEPSGTHQITSFVPPKPSVPFFEGEKKVPLKTYRLPKVVEDRIEKEEESVRKEIQNRESYRLSQAAKKIQLEGLSFSVDLDRKKMKFIGRLKSKGQLIEEVELEGSFDPSASLWTSNDLFPVNDQVRAEKRMQATAVCLDVNVCDRVAVRFYIQYEGELLSLHFEKEAVSIGKVTSGHDSEEEGLEDLLDDDSLDESVETEAPPKVTKPSPPVVEEDGVGTGTNEPTETEEEELSDQDRYHFDDGAFEYSSPTQAPDPIENENSIQGIQKYASPRTTDEPQAIGRHNKGRLQNATTLPAEGPGFLRRGKASTHNAYGTTLMISLIQKAAEVMEKASPGGTPILVGDISRKTGRKLKRHASHQNGLDADIAFPSKQSRISQFWNILTGSQIKSSMDKKRFWQFAKGLVCSKSSKTSHVMVIFVDRRIKKEMCEYARQAGENLSDRSSCGAYQTLRSMMHWPGHRDHIHVRAYCPGTVGCSNTEVTLPNSSGC